LWTAFTVIARINGSIYVHWAKNLFLKHDNGKSAVLSRVFFADNTDKGNM